jgi:hypothetical protein
MLLVSIIIDCTRGLIIDSTLAINTEIAIENILIKHNLLKYQVNQICITNVNARQAA